MIAKFAVYAVVVLSLALTVYAQCSALRTCRDCIGNTACGWCVTNASCVSGTTQGPSGGNCTTWNYRNCTNVECMTATCAQCAFDTTCKYCYTTGAGMCMSTSSTCSSSAAGSSIKCCPSGCSNNGNCKVDGMCTCNTGYMGTDCATKKSAAGSLNTVSGAVAGLILSLLISMLFM